MVIKSCCVAPYGFLYTYLSGWGPRIWKNTEKSLNHQSNAFETKESHRDLIPDGKMKGILMFCSTVNKTDQCKTLRNQN